MLIPGLSQVYNPFNVTSAQLKQEIKMRSFRSKELNIPTITGILIGKKTHFKKAGVQKGWMDGGIVIN